MQSEIKNSNNYSKEELQILRKLQAALKSHDISTSCYSLNGYGESAICLCKCDNGYEIFEWERGNKSNSQIVSDLKKACLLLIKRVSYSEEQRKIEKQFKQLLHNPVIVCTTPIKASTDRTCGIALRRAVRPHSSRASKSKNNPQRLRVYKSKTVGGSPIMAMRKGTARSDGRKVDATIHLRKKW